MSQLFRTKSIDALIAASEEPGKRLRKTLGPWSLTALGVGAVIGGGIFTLTGTAAAGKVEKINSIFNATVLDLVTHGMQAGSMTGRPGAGPAITLSFVLVAIACCFSAVCYAELASMIPIAGSAYTYSYAILGELVAWVIGWDLILEYAVSNMSVAVGFSAYIQDLFENLFGFHLPAQIAYPAIPAPGQPSGIFKLRLLARVFARGQNSTYSGWSRRSDPKELWAAEGRPMWSRSRPNRCFAPSKLLWTVFTGKKAAQDEVLTFFTKWLFFFIRYNHCFAH